MEGEQYLKAAYAYLYIRDFEKAKEAFERAISSNPDNATYYFHASVTAMRSSEFDLAMSWATRALILEPENTLYDQHLNVIKAAMLNANGKEAYLNGNVELAKQYFTDALLLDPLNDDAESTLRMLSHLNDELPRKQEEDTG